MRLRQLYWFLGLCLGFQLLVESIAEEKPVSYSLSGVLAQWEAGHAGSEGSRLWAGRDEQGHLPAQSPHYQHGGSKHAPATATVYALRLGDQALLATLEADPAHAQTPPAPALHPDRQALYCNLLL
jgi:hypothetical protein